MNKPNIVSDPSQSIADLRAEGEVAWAENRAINAQFVEHESRCDSKAVPDDDDDYEDDDYEDDDD